MARWLLPENLSDALPEEARTVERLRRSLLDLYASYGYELVIPPLLEHLDSLLTGTGHDLDLSTLKLVDQLSGRTLGLRADTTPQVARIDAHILNRAGIARLCYAGSTLHARPMHPLASREPLQVGAEIYGDADPAADREILDLAVRSARCLLATSSAARVQLDLGHTGVVRALLREDPAAQAGAEAILAALTGKDPAALGIACSALAPRTQAALQCLLTLNGGLDVMERARGELPASPALHAALDELSLLAPQARADAVGVDLADLHGFRYHTGITFAVYVPGLSGPVLRGGRYDDIGLAFGRARPATGFSLLDLREAARLAVAPPVHAVRAPRGGPPGLDAAVARLRGDGTVVIQADPGSELGVALAIDRELAWEQGAWRVRAVAAGGGIG